MRIYQMIKKQFRINKRKSVEESLYIVSLMIRELKPPLLFGGLIYCNYSHIRDNFPILTTAKCLAYFPQISLSQVMLYYAHPSSFRIWKKESQKNWTMKCGIDSKMPFYSLSDQNAPSMV